MAEPCRPAVLVGAGDIAGCSQDRDVLTGLLVDSIEGEVFTAGDNVQGRGSFSEYRRCFDPAWGRHRARIRPAPGNHEYLTPGAAGYFDYFGAAAGPRGLGFYYVNKGSWRIFSLNSEANVAASAQFLRDSVGDVACVAAIWHTPHRSSARSIGRGVEVLWQAAYDAGVDLVINGHHHHYERFAPLDRAGAVAGAGERGMREFVVGTGGTTLEPFGPVAAGSEVRNDNTHGVLSVELQERGYAWRFHPIAGDFTDAGVGSC